jgi:hypothetical protein
LAARRQTASERACKRWQQALTLVKRNC